MPRGSVRTMRSRVLRILAAGGAALVALAPAAWSAATGIELTPAKIESDLSRRSFRTDLLLVNHDSESRRLALSVAGLGHDLDGTWQFLEPAAETDAVDLSTEGFTLASLDRRSVRLRAKIPDGKRGLYAAVLAEFSNAFSADATVVVRSRVASLLLIRGPKPWNEQVKVSEVSLRMPEKGRRATVYAILENTGNVHVYPRGRVEIRKDGRLLATVRLDGGKIVIPEFARRLTGTWTVPPDLTGRIELTAIIEDPSARGTGFFDLSGHSAGRAAAMFSALRASASPRPAVVATLANTGGVAIAPKVVLVAIQGRTERARTVLPQPRMRPGDAREIEWRPALADGVYRVRAQAWLGDRLLDTRDVGLRVGAVASERAPGLGRLLLALLALLLLGLVSWLLAVARRRREEKRRAERRAPAAERPVAARRPHRPGIPPRLTGRARAGRR